MGYISTFALDITACIDQCLKFLIIDKTDWVSVLYSDLQTVTISVTKYNSVYSTGIIDITSSYINKATTGTITCNGTDNKVTGTGTLFLSEATVGKFIVVKTTNQAVKIKSITDDTQLITDEILSAVTNVDYYILDPYINIYPVSLGLTTFIDGRYDITFIVTTTTETYTKIISYYNTCSIQCCIIKAVAGLKDYYNCNICDQEYITYVETLNSLYQSLVYNAINYKFTEADTILELLKNLCNQKNCNCN